MNILPIRSKILSTRISPEPPGNNLGGRKNLGALEYNVVGRLTIGSAVMIRSFLVQEKPSTAFERKPSMHNFWQKMGPTEEPCAYQAVRAVPSAYERHDETCAASGLTMMTQFPG
jgi:hypothetical protein